jgi:hypothetical protein
MWGQRIDAEKEHGRKVMKISTEATVALYPASLTCRIAFMRKLGAD